MTRAERPVAIVTGGSRGIGAGLVAAYRDRGWAVLTVARDAPTDPPPDVLAVTGDLRDPATAHRAVGGALERFGRLDTLVNNAGVYIGKPFTEYTDDDYATAVGVNLTGFFLITRLAVAAMLTRSGGHVVTITTTLAEYGDSTVPCMLTALTKGGLAAATRSLAIEYASRGIRFNAVSPGVIRTPPHPVEEYAALAARHPLGRVGEVDDVVRAVMFLESSPFVTGEIVHVDGGQSAGH